MPEGTRAHIFTFMEIPDRIFVISPRTVLTKPSSVVLWFSHGRLESGNLGPHFIRMSKHKVPAIRHDIQARVAFARPVRTLAGSESIVLRHNDQHWCFNFDKG
jgi:hypothetical protein